MWDLEQNFSWRMGKPSGGGDVCVPDLGEEVND